MMTVALGGKGGQGTLYTCMKMSSCNPLFCTVRIIILQSGWCPEYVNSHRQTADACGSVQGTKLAFIAVKNILEQKIG
jgi:hypothetical protein